MECLIDCINCESEIKAKINIDGNCKNCGIKYAWNFKEEKEFPWQKEWFFE
jgi:hypothetical protein